MQLRNRNIGSTNTILPVVQAVVPSHNQLEFATLTPNITMSEHLSYAYANEICSLIQTLIAVLPTIGDNANLTENEKFNDNIRVIREIFNIIKYYDLKSNPRFSKFILVSIDKSYMYLAELRQELKGHEYIEKPEFSTRRRISPRNKDIYSIKEFINELEQFISM